MPEHAPKDAESEGAITRTRERILRRLPDHIARGKIVEAVVGDLAAEVAAVEGGIRDLMESRWIEAARGEALDGIAALFLLRRAPEETDDAFRRRISLTLREILAGSGTIDSLRKIIIATLGIEPEITENPP